MRLMPTESPQMEGLDIAGRCIPANHVGGDFFQFFERDGKIAVCMADASGKAMGAAVPVMMFSGVLENEMDHGTRLEELFGRLNGSLCRSLAPNAYVCLALAEVD